MFTLAIKAKVQLHDKLDTLYGAPSEAYEHVLVPFTVNTHDKVCVEVFTTHQQAVTAREQYIKDATLESTRAGRTLNYNEYASDDAYYAWLDMADFVETNLVVAPISKEQVEYLENSLSVDVFVDATGHGLLYGAIESFINNGNEPNPIKGNPVLLNSLPRLREK